MQSDIHPAEERKTLMELSEGREQAFTLLYHKYSRPLYARIRHIIKCEETSKEILQDIFMRVWERRGQIDCERPFRPYIYRIAENKVIDHLRRVARDKKMTAYFVSSAMDVISDPTHQDPDYLLWLEKALDQLPPTRKKVYTLSKLEAKSYTEIAKQLGISESTVSDHIVKANRTIKNYLLQNPDVVLACLCAQLIGTFLS